MEVDLVTVTCSVVLISGSGVDLRNGLINLFLLIKFSTMYRRIAKFKNVAL